MQGFSADKFNGDRRLFLTQSFQVSRLHTRIVRRRSFGGLFGKGWGGGTERHAQYCSPKFFDSRRKSCCQRHSAIKDLTAKDAKVAKKFEARFLRDRVVCGKGVLANCCLLTAEC